MLLAKKHIASGEIWSRGVREKDKLSVGDCVSVQQLAGKSRNKWNLSGAVVDIAGPESYWIRLDGSGRLSKRKRQHIKPIFPFLKQLEKSTSIELSNSIPDDKSFPKGPTLTPTDLGLRRSERLGQKSGGGGGDSGGQ